MLGLVLVLLGTSLADQHSFCEIVLQVNKLLQKKAHNISHEYAQQTLCHIPHPPKKKPNNNKTETTKQMSKGP